jgi:seryl-tRNA synthetase
MLTINLIREKKEFVIERLKVKNFKAEEIIDRIIALDTSRRDIQTRTDLMLSEMNRKMR